MESNYISERLQGQMNYYKGKCKALKREYYVLSIISIVANALIPIFTIFIETSVFAKYVIASLSAVSTVLCSILLLRKTKEKWTEYRITYEQLKYEKVMYTSGVGIYNNGDEKIFIEKCESIMCKEHNSWFDLMKSSEHQEV